MILYHFCAAHMVESILEEGLTEGIFPHMEGDAFEPIPKCQWLTADDDPKQQSWATRIMVKYSRTAYRLTINIPESYRKKVIRATDFVKGMPQYDQDLIYNWAGYENWYIFKGKIPPKWIVGCHKMKE